MLKLAGVQGSPGARLLIGAALLAVGLARNGVALMLIGGAFVVWGVVALAVRQ